jgi:murein DD-endopeptidase MepM/ murein hydrolase activator NlpD
MNPLGGNLPMLMQMQTLDQMMQAAQQIMMNFMQMLMGGQGASPQGFPQAGMNFGGFDPSAFADSMGLSSPATGGGSAPGGAPAASGAAPAASVGGKSAGGGFVSPVDNYRVSSRFGPRRAPTAGASTNHKGIDLAAPLNTPIRAAKGGTVTISKDQPTGYGKWIEIRHDDGTKTRYGHLNARDVQVGAKVQAGQVIGKMGSTGTSTGSHLHFEVLNANGVQINPESVMKF